MSGRNGEVSSSKDFRTCRRIFLHFSAAIFLVSFVLSVRAGEHQVLEASGSFPERSGSQGIAVAYYPVTIPSRGWFRSETSGTPALFGGPDGNSPYYHFSSQLTRVGEVVLFNFTTTNIEVAPVITQRSELLPAGGYFQARVIGPQRISFTFGDFIYGDAQSFTAKGFFDPSPVANAGPNLVIESGAGGTLQGAGTDVDGDALTYSWTRLLGPNLSLASDTAAQPTIQAPVVTQATTTRMQLIVSDAHSASLPDTIDVLIYPPGGNIPPLVNAGADGSGSYTTTIPLDGSLSSDVDGTVKFYSWTQTAGPRVDLSDPATAEPTFKQYEPESSDQYYQFELVVSDGLDLSAPDTAAAEIQGYRDNAVPVGPRETNIFAGNGAVPEVTQAQHNAGTPPATLDIPNIPAPGSGRLRAEVLGTPGLFNGPDGNNPNFHLSSQGERWDGALAGGFRQTDIETAPVVTNTFFDTGTGGNKTLKILGPQALSYTFYDYLYGEAQSFDVNVWFRPTSLPPTADAGAPKTIASGKVVQLDGRASSDPDGDPLSYLWSQTGGTGATLSNNQSPVPLFKAPSVDAPTTLTFSLVVNDGVASPPDATTVFVFVDVALDQIADYVLGSGTLTPGQLLSADLNSDTQVDVGDIVRLINILNE